MQDRVYVVISSMLELLDLGNSLDFLVQYCYISYLMNYVKTLDDWNIMSVFEDLLAITQANKFQQSLFKRVLACAGGEARDGLVSRHYRKR